MSNTPAPMTLVEQRDKLLAAVKEIAWNADQAECSSHHHHCAARDMRVIAQRVRDMIEAEIAGESDSKCVNCGVRIYPRDEDAGSYRERFCSETCQTVSERNMFPVETFTREQRYIVLKISDMVNLTPGLIGTLNKICRLAEEHRRLYKKAPLECVVVESNWPEYEPTWKAIEGRVNR